MSTSLAQLPAYAELHAISNFSFGHGASHPHELVERAHALGYSAIALADECSVAGVVRAHARAKELGLPFIPGARFTLPGSGHRIVVLPNNAQGWGNLCEFISHARMHAPKGEYSVQWPDERWASLSDCEVLMALNRNTESPTDAINSIAAHAIITPAKALFGSKLWLAAELLLQADDALWLQHLEQLSQQTGVPLVAAGSVCMHARSRKPLHDVLAAIRLGKTVMTCGFELQANAEAHLRPRARLSSIYSPQLLTATQIVASRCRFSLDEIRYNYPQETVLPGLTATQTLRQLTEAGARERYPHGVPAQITAWIEKELALIEECQYEMFFLTVHDIVQFARLQGILCQGRGSAANSVVCYCLGITAANPMYSSPLLERFISRERRNEPPDIDVDFEHERREEVIQYIYTKYGRQRAALAATVIGWRTRSALRDVGKALAVDEKLIDAFAKDHHWFDNSVATERLQGLAQDCGVPISPRQALLWLELTRELLGFPRHLSQHVGGFVLTQTKLTRLVPIENAAMKERSVIQWEKDDLESLGMLKVDVLALGMLSAIRRCIQLVSQRRGYAFTRYHVTPEDTATYEMIRRADTIGVFQIESRAQMSMLPRLKPETFYDLVVEVAIVRPGPISGGMVHPYLKARERRRQGLPIEYERSAFENPAAKPRLSEALERTLGIPIFQEQVMQLAIIAAGFSPGQADALRRSMAAWKRSGGVHKFREPLIAGMQANGYRVEFAEAIFKQILGFGEYGFPESHAYSFALLAYESSWLKCHEPECFLAAMLNSQPLGFYPPSQLIQDAQRHGVQVLPIDVSHSDWDSKLIGVRYLLISGKLVSDPHYLGASDSPRPAVRLGLRLVGGLSEAAAQRLVAVRSAGEPWRNVEDMAQRAQLDAQDCKALAAADALQSIAGHRRQQVWQATAQQSSSALVPLLRDAPVHEVPLALPAASEGEEILFDYAATGLSLRRHPLALLRPKLARLRLPGMPIQSAQALQQFAHGRLAAACGLVTVRQRPQTAKGTVFVTLEDETGVVNVIVWKDVREQYRDALLRSRLLAVHGQWQRDEDSGGQVQHLVARRLTDLSHLLGRFAHLNDDSRRFH
jgi:error-prone DNA polymerase